MLAPARRFARILTLAAAGAALSAPLVLASAASADVPPPDKRPSKPADLTPRGVVDAVSALDKAMRDGDEKLARQQVDPRGWDANLVGGSGTTMASFFAQGARKGWYPRIAPGSAVDPANGKTFIVSLELPERKSGRVTDLVHALFVMVDGQWKLLAAGENASEVAQLAERINGPIPTP